MRDGLLQLQRTRQSVITSKQTSSPLIASAEHVGFKIIPSPCFKSTLEAEEASSTRAAPTGIEQAGTDAAQECREGVVDNLTMSGRRM